MEASGQRSKDYSIQDESYRLLSSALLDHPLYSRNLPRRAKEFASRIRFTGSQLPCIPVNWRFAESVATLKALEGMFTNTPLVGKYNVEPEAIEITNDHAQLFNIFCLLTSVSADGAASVESTGFDAKTSFPSCDLHGASASPYCICASNIYRTKDDRFSHLHTDLKPSVVHKALNLPSDIDGEYEVVCQVFQSQCLRFDAEDLDRRCNDTLCT